MKVAIIGLGYVGLPLALACTEAQISVLGVDLDQSKVDQLNHSCSYISHVSDRRIQVACEANLFEATTDVARIKECSVILICVPTPLKNNYQPDLSYVLDTAKSIAPYLKQDVLIILESTTYPGTTQEELLPIIESGSQMKAGKGFFLAYSPEREDPGNGAHFKSIPKVVGGVTANCLDRAISFYKNIVNQVVPVSSCEVAEGAKLMENIFRSVNIALVNELKVIYSKMGIDIWEVIEAAKTKPFGFMPFYPGPGWGGHCIPIDPYYLTWKAKQYGEESQFIELAGNINRKMPEYVIECVVSALKDDGKNIKGSRILILGLAYKPDVDDDRESPSYVLIEQLEDRGCEINFNDPYISEIKKTREHSRLQGRKSSDLNGDYDLFLLVTAHRAYIQKDFSELSIPLVDTRNCISKRPRKYYQA